MLGEGSSLAIEGYRKAYVVILSFPIIHLLEENIIIDRHMQAGILP